MSNIKQDLDELAESAEERALLLMWEMNPEPDKDELSTPGTIVTETGNTVRDAYVWDSMNTDCWISFGGELLSIEE